MKRTPSGRPKPRLLVKSSDSVAKSGAVYNFSTHQMGMQSSTPWLSARRFELIVLLAAICSTPRTAVAVETKPNIVWVVVDDLGWADVSWHSQGQTLTPHLDKLRQTGVELTNMQVFKFCTPTRSSFMTGRLPFHTLQVLANVPMPCIGLQLNYTLLPELLQGQGYHTAHVGKWHLGAFSERYLPTARGFNESLAYLCLSGSYDHFTQAGQLYCPGGVDLWLNDGPARSWNGTFDALMYSEFAVDVIHRHAARAADAMPLYLHLEYHVVHEPVQSPTSYQDRYPHVTNPCRKAYCGMLSALDDGVANVTTALAAAGMSDNTIFVVTSDNGGLVDQNGCGANYPLRGGKHSFFAGGIQGIAFVHSPLLPASATGTVFTGLSHASDWYPTLAMRAGILDLSSTGIFPVDGVDIWPFLSGERGGNPHHELLIEGGQGKAHFLLMSSS